jgi:hypothetical protein
MANTMHKPLGCPHSLYFCTLCETKEGDTGVLDTTSEQPVSEKAALGDQPPQKYHQPSSPHKVRDVSLPQTIAGKKVHERCFLPEWTTRTQHDFLEAHQHLFGSDNTVSHLR